ncbi:MAG: FimB/Mfa2 family fimbrial subunit [Muribaculaceae bacterium]|nr:FimB/Mfa2 family fimbrial subunit [Muribaculaceae bacterium]
MKFRKLYLLPVAALMLTSCNNPVFDDEGDCRVHYYLQFVYDMNLKWADAFPSEVNSVNLYAFKDGKFVKDYMLRGEELSQPGYTLELDLDPGTYELVAWCGLYNDGKEMESFTVPTPVEGVTTLDDLTCTLNTTSTEEYPVFSNSRLYFMYHGNMEVELPDSMDGASYNYTMSLTKDTNHIRIILQQLSAEDMDPDQFQFIIEDSDGKLAWDNSLLGDETVVYSQWDCLGGLADVSTENSNGESELVTTQCVIADLSVSRMMDDHSKEFFLTVIDLKADKNLITRVPVIQYALLSKEYYELAYNHPMTNQEFLDREDEYVLTFFLDQNLRWVNSYIYINSWRIVLNNYGLGNKG